MSDFLEQEVARVAQEAARRVAQREAEVDRPKPVDAPSDLSDA